MDSSLEWLLEPSDINVRYLTLRDLLHRPQDDRELQAAAEESHLAGAIHTVLQAMQPEGYWEKPGPGYSPKYRSTVWAITLLAQLGADIRYDARIRTACQYVLDHALSADGRFSYNESPSGTFDCLQGNLSWALLELGCQDERLDLAIDWLARSQTGEGIAPLNDKKAPVRYTAYKCGPDFACGANMKFPCAWGAVKVLNALSRVPPTRRTQPVQKAISAGIDFLFSVDPASAAYPTPNGQSPNRSWWKFGFPVFYVTDVLQIAEVMARLGLGEDGRLTNLAELILSKRDNQGKWPLEYIYGSKTWGNYGRMKQPNKWVTLRAMRVLQHIAPRKLSLSLN